MAPRGPGYRSSMPELSFPFAVDPRFRLPARLAAVDPGAATVQVDDERLTAVFGRWRVETPLANVAGAAVTGPYSLPKVIGPAHLSMRDRGLTFATNARAGVCIRFVTPVRGIDPFGLVRHPALTVTVADTGALAELLDRTAHDSSRTHTPTVDLTAEDASDADVVTLSDLQAEVHDDLRALSAAELRERARGRGISGVSRRSKSELLELLEAPLQPAHEEVPANPRG
jgi:hypothetical protein